ncbi:bone morphogenetic protein 7-like isoform X1 [Xiphophorus hellerii]|uniref:bone morphogenetic protein 7-like isoform X1 n=1 Tax=Xiphophorus hellerii TaxID=8084 RepID=UPI0013B41EB8|nr:bone morphogenetic protein 7-like isoform X1 [Xiphophorus hellerii]
MLVALLLLSCWGSCASATRVSFSNFSVDSEARSSFIHRRLRSQERREIQREILSILGLPQRPRPHAHTKHNAAPTFMLDLYNTVSTEAEPRAVSRYRAVLQGQASAAVSQQDSRFLDDADTVMSFVNLVDGDRDLLVRPHAQAFRFDISRIPEGEAITAAEFRIYKDFIRERDGNETFRVSVYQVLQEPPDRQPQTDPKAAGQVTLTSASSSIVFEIPYKDESDVALLLLDQRDVWASDDGWLVFDLTATSTLWQLSPEQNLGLHLVLQDNNSQKRNPRRAGLLTGSGPKDKQPFLVVFFKVNEVRFRGARSAPGQKGRQSNRSKQQKAVQEALRAAEAGTDALGLSKEGCKKHELYVSFRDLGWQDWIIAPEGYAAYYCEGECAFPLNSDMNATNHAIVQTLVHFINPETVPQPCCAPTQLNGISVLYFDDSSNVILKKYRNMVVRACGCH